MGHIPKQKQNNFLLTKQSEIHLKKKKISDKKKYKWLIRYNYVYVSMTFFVDSYLRPKIKTFRLWDLVATCNYLMELHH